MDSFSFRRFRPLVLLATSVVPALFMGCSQNSSPAESRPEVRAEKEISSSFGVAAASDLQLKIQKTALDREFLLMGEMIWPAPTAVFRGLKSRIVAFKKVGSQLVMLEATHGHLISDVYPSQFLLAQFPITSESETELTFDFNSGMRQIYTEGSWWASDLSKFDSTHTDEAEAVNSSFISEVSEVDNNLVIRQVAQVSLASGMRSVEAKYYLTPYRPNPAFKPTAAPKISRVGYFEVSPHFDQSGDGVEHIFASKFDIAKPIVFALSANTPQELRPMFTEAILYWNRVLGANGVPVVQVVQLTDPKIVAPDVRYNIIQWVGFDSSGAAYADAQPDPRTGEVLHAQVYIPSAFYSGAKASLAVRLRRFIAQQTAMASAKSNRSSAHTSLCSSDFSTEALEGLLDLSMTDIPEDVFRKVVHDYIANTVAHEVGHVLGLRHNFAGSLGSNYPRATMRDEFQNYVANKAQNTKDLRPSSSVMEYSAFEERVLSGNVVRNSASAPLLYDVKALGVLYFDRPIDDSIPLFCTDSQLGLTDCKKSDMGTSILEDTSLTMAEKLDEHPSRFMSSIFAAKEANEDIATVSFDAKATAKAILDYRSQTMAMLTNQTSLLSVRKIFDVTAQVTPGLLALEQQYISSEVKRLGGLEAILSPIPKDYAVVSVNRLERLLKIPSVAAGLSQREKETVLQHGRLFYPLLERALVEQDLKSLALTTLKAAASSAPPAPLLAAGGQPLKLSEEAVVLSELQKVFSKRVELYALSKSATKIDTAYTRDGATAVQIQLPIYEYSFPIRTAAVALLSADLSSAVDYAWNERATARAQLALDMRPSADIELKDASNPALSSAARVWILENKRILRALE